MRRKLFIYYVGRLTQCCKMQKRLDFKYFRTYYICQNINRNNDSFWSKGSNKIA